MDGLEKVSPSDSPTTWGMIFSTGCPSSEREVTTDSSISGWPSKSLTSSRPVYPEAPITHAFMWVKINLN
jgi:hypothetical protein